MTKFIVDAGKVRISVSIVLIMLISSVLSPIKAQSEVDVGPTIDLATAGELLLLDSDSNTISGFSLNVLAKTGNLDDAKLIETKVFDYYGQPIQNKLISLAHDDSNLYLGTSDGLLFDYYYHDGNTILNHWKLDGVYPIASGVGPVSGLEIVGDSLLWVSEADTKVRILDRANISETSVFEYNDAGVNGLTSVVYNSGNIGAPISMLDSDGGLLLSSDRLGGIANNGNDKFESRNIIGSSKGGVGSIVAVDGITIDYEEKSEEGWVVIDDSKLKILEKGDSVKTRYNVHGNNSENNWKNPPFGVASVINGKYGTSSQIELPKSSEDRRCFPLTLSFANTSPWTFKSKNQTIDGGMITLSVAGVEINNLTHDQVSGKTLTFTPEVVANSDPLLEDFCKELPNTLELKITEWFPSGEEGSDFNAVVVVEPPGTKYDPSTNEWVRSRFDWNVDRGVSQEPVVSLGRLDSFDTKLSVDLGRFGSANDVSICTSCRLDIPLMQNESVSLISLRPVQSVWEPERFMQGKNTWFELEYSYSRNAMNQLIGRDYIDAELLLQGWDCSETRVLFDNYNTAPYEDLVVTSTQGRAIETQYAESNCEKVWRFPGIGRAEEISAPTDPVLITDLTNIMLEEYTRIRLQLPVNFGMGGNTVTNKVMIPFDNIGLDKYDDVWLRPATPDSPNYLGDGDLYWSASLDQYHKIESSASERSDNYASGSGESAEFEVVYGDTFDVRMYRTEVIWENCDDWGVLSTTWDYITFWNGAEAQCDDRNDAHFQLSPLDHTLDVAAISEDYMQRMYPIPEGGVHVGVSTYQHSVTIRDRMLIPDFLEGSLTPLFMISDAASFGINGENTPERTVLFVARESDNSDYLNFSSGENTAVGPWAFGGISPCSRSAIVIDNEQDFGNQAIFMKNGVPMFSVPSDLASTLVHEIGHSLRVGHDNNAFFDHTWNDCGLSELYDPDEIGEGWTPPLFNTGNSLGCWKSMDDFTLDQYMDGVDDCWDGSDELEYGLYIMGVNDETGEDIKEYGPVYFCPTGDRIRGEAINEGHNSCGDWSDESNPWGYMSGESFMRYESDGGVGDGPWGYGNEWIQNSDYDHIIDDMDRLAIDDWVGEWFGSAIESSVIELIELVKSILRWIIETIYGALEWVAEGIQLLIDYGEDLIESVVDAMIDMIANADLLGRSDINQQYIHVALLVDDGGVIIPVSETYRGAPTIGDENITDDYMMKLFDGNNQSIHTSNAVLRAPNDMFLSGGRSLVAEAPALADAVRWEIHNREGSIVAAGLMADEEASVTADLDLYSDENIVINWDHDLVGDTYSDIQISDDHGKTWKTIVSDTGGNLFKLDTSNWFKGHEYKFRIIVDNGKQSVVSDPITYNLEGLNVYTSWTSGEDVFFGDSYSVIVEVLSHHGNGDDCKFTDLDNNIMITEDGVSNRARVDILLDDDVEDVYRVFVECGDNDVVYYIANPLNNNMDYVSNRGDGLLTWGEDCDDGAHVNCDGHDHHHDHDHWVGVIDGDVLKDYFADLDGDGVLDNNDRCLDSRMGVSVGKNGCAVEKIIVTEEVIIYKDSNNSESKEDDEKVRSGLNSIDFGDSSSLVTLGAVLSLGCLIGVFVQSLRRKD